MVDNNIDVYNLHKYAASLTNANNEILTANDHCRETDYTEIGNYLLKMNDKTGAKEAFARSLATNLKKFGENHPNVASDLFRLGMVAKDGGDKNKAKEYFMRSLAIYESLLPIQQNELAFVRRCLDKIGND
jgi:tetratricopeptide (TPR) repeat protein